MQIKVDMQKGLSLKKFQKIQTSRLYDALAEQKPLPDDLAEWLGRLRLLYGVPFEYLVPDERMLPKESIRFFYVDRNWLDRLVDGALTIGKISSRDYLHHQNSANSLRNSLSIAEASTRKQLRGDDVDLGNIEVGGTISGVLIRSTVVEDYPGLEVRAYNTFGKGHDSHKLPLLRMDRLAPGILFCLFQGVPKHMELEEPREGIQFGMEDGMVIRMRQENGSYTEGNKTVNIKMRSGSKRVVDVAALAADPTLTEGLGRKLSSSEIALQFLQFPYLQFFEKEGSCAESVGGAFKSPFAESISFKLFVEGTEHQVNPVIQQTIEENLKEIVEPGGLDPILK